MKESFAIWLARADKCKVFQEVSHPAHVAKVKQVLSLSVPVSSIPSTPVIPPPQSCAHSASSEPLPVFSSMPVGLRNLGQTCYVNAMFGIVI